MSPDNVFAAQMWAWPDAVIKRNAHGQVMVVNAAFLHLYGGAVEDWQGNLVQGWCAPPQPGSAIRFETRVPDAASSSDRVFDWIESALPDGSSLAVARDVTAIQPTPGQTMPADGTVADASSGYAAQPPAAEPVFETVMASPPAAEAPSNQIPAAQAHTPQAPDAQAPAVQAPVAQAPVAQAPITQAPIAQTPVTENPVSETHVTEAPVSNPPASPELPQAAASVAASSAPAIPDTAHTAPDDAVEDVALDVAVEDVPAVSEAEPQDTREFERRALPLEGDSAVLGNNWRDAVIAKAVGATGPEDEVQDTAPVSAHEAAPEATTPTGAEGTRILLAEDNAINALLTRTLLEAEGCIVDTVEDGIYAVEAMKTKAYDLIFMDMRMPQMDGLIATRKIRAMDHASKGLPIVALTANAFDDDRNACYDAGMNDFMTKPVSAEELSEMVAAWTGPDAKAKLEKAAV